MLCYSIFKHACRFWSQSTILNDKIGQTSLNSAIDYYIEDKDFVHVVTVKCGKSRCQFSLTTYKYQPGNNGANITESSSS